MESFPRNMRSFAEWEFFSVLDSHCQVVTMIVFALCTTLFSVVASGCPEIRQVSLAAVRVSGYSTGDVIDFRACAPAWLYSSHVFLWEVPATCKNLPTYFSGPCVGDLDDGEFMSNPLNLVVLRLCFALLRVRSFPGV